MFFLCSRKHKTRSNLVRDFVMANTACFMIVARNDIPIYEAEVGSAAKVK